MDRKIAVIEVERDAVPRIWLHIGMLKTGTTAMQQWCAEYEDELRRQRLLYVRVRKHLPACGPMADALARRGPEGEKLVAKVLGQIDEAGDGVDDVLISSEAFSHHGPHSLAPLVEALRGHEIFILIWLRRQDRFAEALYKQAVKWSGRTGNIEEFTRPGRLRQLDYTAFLQAWRKAFPDVGLIPHIYAEASSGKKPDSVAALLTAIGRADLIPANSAEWRKNLSPKGELIAHYNTIPSERGQSLRKANRQVMDEFGEVAAGRGDMLPPELARALMDHYTESNRRLREEWFPERSELFPPDVEADRSGPTVDKAVLERFDGLFAAKTKG